MPTVVPPSSPAKLAGDGAEPLTFIVNAPAVAVPPLSLTTCLITISFGWTSSLVTVQTADSPTPSVTEVPSHDPPWHAHPSDAYPAGPVSPSVYVPARKFAPLAAPPAPPIGVGPLALNAKSVITAVPPLSVMRFLTSFSCGAMSSLVTVQVFSSPTAIDPLQSPA